MFYASSLTEDQAVLIAEAYYRSGKDPQKMAAHLGISNFDLELIRHPLVKRQVTKLAQRMRRSYTLEDHLARLQEIRDQAMDDGNLRIALAAELSVGKAAGLYEKISTPEEVDSGDLVRLSSEQIREQLAKLGSLSTLPGPQVPHADEDF